MSTINDGGPAFPCQPKWWDPDDMAYRDGDYVPGMSLRDYFAAKALSGLLACAEDEDYGDQELRSDDYPAYCLEYAESAYEMADAMLKARKS